MLPKYEFGAEVRLTRNVRNDGTYPGLDTGTLLVRRGSIGHVVNVGTFLQDQIIYTVHFLEQDKMVGCREEELIDADAPWVPNRYEFRDKVTPLVSLAIDGEVIAEPGVEGEVHMVLRDRPEGVAYHVRFPGRTLLVPETALQPMDTDAEEEFLTEPEAAHA